MPPEHTPDEIRTRMNALRNALNEDVAQVATGMREKSDWRYYVKTYPWLVAGAATAVGFMLVPRRVEKVERIVADADALAELAKREKFVVAPESQVKSGGGKSFAGSLAALALAAGSRAAMGYMSNQFASFVSNKAAQSDAANSEEEPAYAYPEPKPK